MSDDLGSLYDRLAPGLYRYALMILADRDDAADAIQQVFATLVRRGTAGLQETDHYLRRAVRNECYSALRRRRDRPSHESAAVPLESIAAESDRPDERIAIERALALLPPDQREVVHLKVFEGLTFKEIADVTGESINTMASRYRYGMDKLRTALR